jgi:hypothetical protein
VQIAKLKKVESCRRVEGIWGDGPASAVYRCKNVEHQRQCIDDKDFSSRRNDEHYSDKDLAAVIVG